MTFFDFVKRQDLFAIPVQLTYKGERAFSSFTGGCCSILFVLIAVAIFAHNSHSFYKNPEFGTSASVSYTTYSDDTPPSNLPTNGTTMAILVNYETYVRVRFSQKQNPNTTHI